MAWIPFHSETFWIRWNDGNYRHPIPRPVCDVCSWLCWLTMGVRFVWTYLCFPGSFHRRFHIDRPISIRYCSLSRHRAFWYVLLEVLDILPDRSPSWWSLKSSSCVHGLRTLQVHRGSSSYGVSDMNPTWSLNNLLFYYNQIPLIYYYANVIFKS